MKTLRPSLFRAIGWVTAGACATLLSACGGGSDSSPAATPTLTATSYRATNVVSDVNTSGNPYNAANADARLVNAWGIA